MPYLIEVYIHYFFTNDLQTWDSLTKSLLVIWYATPNACDLSSDLLIIVFPWFGFGFCSISSVNIDNAMFYPIQWGRLCTSTSVNPIASKSKSTAHVYLAMGSVRLWKQMQNITRIFSLLSHLWEVPLSMMHRKGCVVVKIHSSCGHDGWGVRKGNSVNHISVSRVIKDTYTFFLYPQPLWLPLMCL